MRTYLESMNVAGWSRGMSEQQLNAILSLNGFLVDDFEQGTSFRVKKFLYKLGLNPMISDRKINQMIQLSRGNDLAFLFFILEAYYKVVEPSCGKKQKKIYTSNEQLIMTTIKELDLMMTLRELDRILPTGQPKEDTEDISELKDTGECVLEKHKQPPLNKKTEKMKSSPYFQKQPRPKERKPMKVKSKSQLNSVVEFDFWKEGKSPTYNVTNEKRWFAEYKFNPSLRVVKDSIKMAINSLFEQIEQPEVDNIDSRKTSGHLLVDPNELLPESVPEPSKNPNLCEHHKAWAEQIQLEKDKLKLQARERCLQVIDTTLRYRTAQRARIVEQLDNDLNHLACKYENLQYATVKLLKGEKCNICENLVFVPGAHPKAPKMISGKTDISHPTTTNRYKTLRLSGGATHINLIPESDISVDNDCIKLLTQYQKELKEQKVRHRRDGCPPKGRKLKFSPKPEQLNLVQCMKSDKKGYFTSVVAHKPYIFNYKRIFRYVNRHVDYQNVIQKSGLKALKSLDQLENTESTLLIDEKELSNYANSNNNNNNNSNSNSSSLSISCTSNPVICRIREHKSKIIDVIHEYVQMVFHDHKSVREQQEQLEKDELEDVVLKPLKYDDIKYFDPNDAKLMDRLLKDGMEVLRQDPRFVLASLPDSHKLRVLQEWIKRRYGKIYTKKEEEEELNSSQEILKNVMESISGPPLLDAMGLSPGELSYAAHNKSVKLAQKVREKYYNKLNEDILGQIGFCYMAVESFFPKATFFAYLPPHSNVITRHHPWKSIEFRDFRFLRNGPAKK